MEGKDKELYEAPEAIALKLKAPRVICQSKEAAAASMNVSYDEEDW